MVNWKHKLLAFLHDPPHKPARIAEHEQQRESFLNRCGLSPEAFRDFERASDWQAAAADRLIFPDPAKSKLRVDWKETWMEFRHPLGGGVLNPSTFPPTAAKLEEELTSALDAVALPDPEDWQRKFIAAWRLWPELAARERNPHLAYLVADTRIPDHTLWHHNSLAAAFAVCGGKPAFLMFQIGPVQEFISQARSTLDLWSGSYLLSFLVAEAMLAIATEIGPDTIVFPQLRGAPLADYYWWKHGFLGAEQRLRSSHPNELLTPNLPNRFLVLAPAAQCEQLALQAEAKVRETWGIIESRVRAFIAEKVGKSLPGWDSHWDSQVRRFPVVDWVVHAWTEARTAMENASKGVPPLHGGWEKHPLKLAARWAEEFIPSGEREDYGPCSNSAFAWALHFATTDWKFAARKNARSFAPWHLAGAPVADGVPKDHLDGQNEVLGGPDHERFWQRLREVCPGKFKGSQLYGAITVIKRLWSEAYLHDTLEWETWRPDFSSVPEIAQIEKAISADANGGVNYYAVLHMDGDNVGQWVSGAKAAPLVNSLAQQAQDYFRAKWPQTADALPSADKVPRPLSPGYHAAFSEALANFSLYCAGPIVAEFGGQLIYAGGDDVLAMTPAATALDCAQALQLAFRGLHPDSPEAAASIRAKEALKRLFLYPADWRRHPAGFLTLNPAAGAVGRAAHLKPNWPLMLMGPRATVSVGVAIGHVHSPMQETIQAARDAEAMAKSISGKAAFSLRILKRSGEEVGFTARWADRTVAIWGDLESKAHGPSRRFAHRYASLVKNLVIIGGSETGARYAESWDPVLKDAAVAELRHVLRRQCGCNHSEAAELAECWCSGLIEALPPRDFLHFWLAWAFMDRIGTSEVTS